MRKSQTAVIFKVELHTKRKSEVFSEVEDMDGDSSVVSCRDGASNSETGENMTKSKISVSDDAKLPRREKLQSYSP